MCVFGGWGWEQVRNSSRSRQSKTFNDFCYRYRGTEVSEISLSWEVSVLSISCNGEHSVFPPFLAKSLSRMVNWWYRCVTDICLICQIWYAAIFFYWDLKWILFQHQATNLTDLNWIDNTRNQSYSNRQWKFWKISEPQTLLNPVCNLSGICIDTDGRNLNVIIFKI